ncbi:hypothetical protein H257_11387 [Aphanomyces astaci]|uniref:Uncharacterized protein n=1 Tax=Aphanomyces astaci TaxID=112090 RepID=W4G4Z0_APHAT|nr:hypothetical protein H257_11387 [Aphanomyces astaci]ETV74079.1 hypothetical protein H257_11387 [Aphanomyces astaci]|eukprot:XP_009836593.1 hypothetical protein H257_11387 [Aphanomyces astaci]
MMGLSTDHRRRTPAMQVQRLQRSVYALEVMLGKAKRQHHSHDGALPWEDVAKALQDDMLEHVREHRVMRQHVEQHRRLCVALQAWIHTMFPPERTLSSELGTWRNCYLFQGSDDARHQAQTWMVQQAYHNTRRAMSTFVFPDTMETCVDVAVTVDDNRMTIQGAVQCTFPHSLHKFSRALWVVENTFTDYVRDRRMPTRSQIQVLDAVRVIYHREEDPSPRQRIQKNSLHGQIEDRDTTTTVFRTIVHDEAFPSQSTTEWILDSSEWYVRSCCNSCVNPRAGTSRSAWDRRRLDCGRCTRCSIPRHARGRYLWKRWRMRCRSPSTRECESGCVLVCSTDMRGSGACTLHLWKRCCWRWWRFQSAGKRETLF